MNTITLPGFLRRSIVETDGARRVLFVASTATPDRYNDIVDQASWRLENYRANPVVLADHYYACSAVVAAGEVSIIDGNLALEITRWSKKQAAQDLKADVEDELVGAVSVGFRPGRSIERSQMPEGDPRKGERGMIYYDCELLEVSLVAIPANPEALAAKAALPSAGDLADAVLDALASDPARRDLLADLLRSAPRDPLDDLFPPADEADPTLSTLFT